MERPITREDELIGALQRAQDFMIMVGVVKLPDYLETLRTENMILTSEVLREYSHNANRDIDL